MKDLNEKNFNTVLTETNDYFASQGVSIIGEGYREVATNAALFENYVDYLTEGASADSAATMALLMANTNANILRESSLTGIQPIASLSMPVIRKLWPKFALKDALKTEVAKTPRFVITYTAPYMYKGEDTESNRVYIPRDIKPTDYNYPQALHKNYTWKHTVNISNGAAAVVDFAANVSSASAAVVDETGSQVTGYDPHVKITNTPSAAKIQPLDELVILSAKVPAVTGAVSVTAVKESNIKIGKALGVYGSNVYDFTYEEASAAGAVDDDTVYVTKHGQLFVNFDGANNKVTFAAIGGAVTVEVMAGVSSEFNEESWSVGFDIKRQDVDIPTGEHINAPLPIEVLNDMMALYQIDGTKETVDLMTNVFAQRLDLQILDFLGRSWANQPGNEAYADYPAASEYYFTFDCKPAAGFAGSPKAWREEIKPLIDHLAQKIKNNTYLSAGMFTIVANPLDVQILANVDWQFRGGQGGNVDGVEADYSIGTYVGANSYRVISSVNVPAGKMFVLFTPSGDTQMTYKYYPYTFSTEMGYVDPNRSRVPSIMMTKRDTLKEFMPAIGVIGITNNDGRGYFAQYENWKEVTD